MIGISIQTEPFDIAAELRALRAGRGDIGAIVTFTGLVRDQGSAGPITAMTLEHYPAMTLRQLQDIADQARQRWPVQAGRIIHRHGRLVPGDDIVLVAIASAHRQAAFDAAQFLMDWLKTRAPFWKREDCADGTSLWVAAREEDEAARQRWMTD